MNKSLRYFAILALVPLFTTGLGTDYFSDADALKGQGVGTMKFGSSTDICGLQLCSEIPGGKEAWMAEKGKCRHLEKTDESSKKCDITNAN